MAVLLRPTLFLPGTTECERTPANVTQYEVRGLPPSLNALIRRKNGHWQILRVKDSVPANWDGDYKTPEGALQAITSEVIA